MTISDIPALQKRLARAGEDTDEGDDDDLPLAEFRRGYGKVRDHVQDHARSLWHAGGGTLGTAQMIGQVVTGGQQLISQMSQLYARNHLGANFKAFIPGASILERPGTSKLSVYMRPAFEATPAAELRRLETLVNTDLQLSKTRTLYAAFDQDLNVNRSPIKIFRRVTGGNPCALCEIAADQVYFSDDLMPIHDNCECDVEEDTGERLTSHQLEYHHIGFVDRLIDIGQQVKAIGSLADEDAPAEAYHNLVSIQQHGELGPVLTWKGQGFTGPGELPTPTEPRPLPGAGPAHEERLQRNQARVEQYRRQAFEDRKEPQYKEGHGLGSSHVRPAYADEAAPDLADFNTEVASRHGGLHISYRGEMDDESGRAATQAIDDMLTKYPQAATSLTDVDEQIAWTGNGDAYARTVSTRGSADLTEIQFNPNYFKDHAEIETTYRHAIDSRFHPDIDGYTPEYAIATHEFGHVLDATGSYRAGERVKQTLLDVFDRTPNGRNFPQFREALFRTWLKDSLSGYSFNTIGVLDILNPAEALGNAFAHVELNPSTASEAEKALHKLLIDMSTQPKLTMYEPRWTTAASSPARIIKRSMPREEVERTAYEVSKMQGGITIDLEGNRPPEGFAYAPNKLTEVSYPTGEFTPEHVDRFIHENMDELSREGNHVGIWEEKGRMYIDISRVGPPTAETIEKAQKADQLGVYDLKNFRTINTGAIDESGRYVRLGTPASVLDKWQGEVGSAVESRSAPGTSEVAGARTGADGRAVAVGPQVISPEARAKARADAEQLRIAIKQAKEKPAAEEQIETARLERMKWQARYATGAKGKATAEEETTRAAMEPARITANRAALFNEIPAAVKAEGATWYSDVGETFSQQYVMHGSPIGDDPLAHLKVQALGASFSPQTKWNLNMADVDLFLGNLDKTPKERAEILFARPGGRRYGDNIDRAERVWAAKSEDEVRLALRGAAVGKSHYYDNGPKITNFWQNLLGHKDNLTLDTWEASASRMSPDERRDLLNAYTAANPGAKMFGQPRHMYAPGERVMGYKEAMLADDLADKANAAAVVAGTPPPYMPNPAMMVSHGYDIIEAATREAIAQQDELAPSGFQAASWTWLRGTGS